MTHEEHKARHILLHQHLDELVADYVRHTPSTAATQLSKVTVMDLIAWSYGQTQAPDEPA